jgi:chromosome segregation ATPase
VSGNNSEAGEGGSKADGMAPETQDSISSKDVQDDNQNTVNSVSTAHGQTAPEAIISKSAAAVSPLESVPEPTLSTAPLRNPSTPIPTIIPNSSQTEAMAAQCQTLTCRVSDLEQQLLNSQADHTEKTAADQKTISKLTQDVKHSKEKLVKVEREKDAYAAKLKQVEEKSKEVVEKLIRENEEASLVWKQKESQWEEERQASRDQISKSTEELNFVSELQEQMKRLKHELEAEKNKTKSVQSKCDLANKGLLELQDKYQNVQADLASERSKTNEAHMAKQETLNELVVLQERLNEVESSLALAFQVEQERDSFKSQLESITSKADAEQLETKRALEESETQVTELRGRVETLSADVSNWKSKAHEKERLEVENADHVAKIKTLENQVQEVTQQCQIATTSAQEHQNSISQLKEQVAKLTTENSRLSKLLSQAQESQSTDAQTTEGLNRELEDVKLKLALYEAKEEEWTTHFEELQVKNKGLVKDVVDRKAESKTHSMKIAKLEESVRGLRKENEALKESLKEIKVQ